MIDLMQEGGSWRVWGEWDPDATDHTWFTFDCDCGTSGGGHADQTLTVEAALHHRCTLTTTQTTEGPNL